MSPSPRALVRLIALPLLVAATILATMSLAPTASAASRADKVRNAANIALKQIGDPYSYGAAGPHRFDCSGLLYYSTHRAGLRGMPRTSSAQSRFTHRIKKSRMRKGDFMFFYGSGGVYHAAIFLKWKGGKAVMLHAPGSGDRVRVARPWTSRWFAGSLR